MFSKFMPHSFNFFELFDKQAGFAVDAAVLFKEMVLKSEIGDEAFQKMRDIEHQGDEAAHSIINHLNTTFITPFDREDIYRLVKELDDVTDMINTITSRIKIYKLNAQDKSLAEFAKVIEESVKEVAKAVSGLRHAKHLKAVCDSCVEINRLENVGDSMRDEVLVELFDTAKDPISVIKWKEVYQDAETVLDICEDVAHVVESILVKQA